ncbi:Hypothetical protein R9X50_00354500 [Acrodontium crateriforme]|uniref:Small ribosomal subunit protein uS10m n=1 Tax=Acrodontium crateriforme TaxID=150365 RepID=A0AAQ3M3L7_9PEZI|nr:Hypothetical protein R9X50_00354500 [Acrodontium crateriforme]
MATPSYARSLIHLTKRLRLSPPAKAITQCQIRDLSSTPQRRAEAEISPRQAEKELLSVRLPRAVQAAYLTPLRREATTKNPVCDLQLRSYSVRNLEAYADFAMRAAYYLNLPAKGPIPLPKITQRWTVPRSNFVFKKSQENFERITLKRLIQIQDGHPEVVAIWLAFLKKHPYYGIGMKANVYEHTDLDPLKDLEGEAERIKKQLGEELDALDRLALGKDSSEKQIKAKEPTVEKATPTIEKAAKTKQAKADLEAETSSTDKLAVASSKESEAKSFEADEKITPAVAS